MYVVLKFHSQYFFSCFPPILVCCIFIFIELMGNSMISLETFCMAHKLRSVLFGCQIFGNFPVSFCYLFILLFHCGWRIHSLYFSSFTLDLLSFFRFQDLHLPGMYSMDSWQEVYSALVGWSVYSWQLNLTG